jgi:hypothetical protein
VKRPMQCHTEWIFGHGLNYATIDYSDLAVSSGTVTGCESVDVRVTVTNNDATITQKHSVIAPCLQSCLPVIGAR